MILTGVVGILKKTLASRFFILISLFLTGTISHAEHTAVVIDADNGQVLHDVAATQPWFPASLTKVMTLYLTFSALKSGLLNLEDPLQVSSYAAQQPNSKLGLEAGEILTVKDAILAVISRSANDAAVALAERLGGTEAKFAAKMTAMARSLKMNTSTFFNATGLPHSRQITTSKDMALLASRIRHDFKVYFPLFSTPGINYKGRTLPNINSFLYAYSGAEGMKTGFTCASGYNLMAAANRRGRHLIGVVMGATTREERNQLMTAILDKGFASNKHDVPFDTLEQMQAAPGAPGYQLPAETCRYDDYSGFAKRSKDIPHIPKYIAGRMSTTLPTGDNHEHISNWTVVLGAFNERLEAENFNRTISNQLDKMPKPGYPVVLQHQTDDMFLWHALWTGLSNETEASNLCKYLWESDIECSVLSPEVIASSDAPWR